MHTTGIILTGGQSSRMGTDKGSLLLSGRPVISRVVDALALVCDELILVGRHRYDFLNITTVDDHFYGYGPIAGLHAGLAEMRGEYAIVAACDMPFINSDLLRAMLRLMQQGSTKPDASPGASQCNHVYDAVVPYINNQPEPLHAVYHRNILTAVSQLIGEQKTSLKQILYSGSLRVCWLEDHLLRQYDPYLHSFFNLNTPEDYRRALALLAHEHNN